MWMNGRISVFELYLWSELCYDRYKIMKGMVLIMREDTMLALKEYEVKIFGNKQNVEALDERIQKNERVSFISPSNITIVDNETGIKNTIPGVIAITDQSIYVLNSMGSDHEGIYPVQSIQRVDFESNGITGSKIDLVLHGVSISFIVSYKKKIARKLHDELIKIGNVTRREESLPLG